MSKRILIVDDTAPARDIVRKHIEHAGFFVCGEAVDGVDAVDKASELKPDLIILDLSLPKLTGIEAAYILKGRLPRTPIVLFTMLEPSLLLTSAAGINCVIHKEEGMNRLMESVRQLMATEEV
jgi:two-component system, chemotaxis family, chemotaxis protein CheY